MNPSGNHFIVCLLLSVASSCAFFPYNADYDTGDSTATVAPVKADLFHGTHWREEYASESHSETVDHRKDKDEGRPQDAGPRYFTHRQPTDDDDDDDDIDVKEDERGHRDERNRNRFPVQGARKRVKPNEHFVWHPFVPAFRQTNYNEYSPGFPIAVSTRSRKPNDILLVVLQQQQPSSDEKVSTSCRCGTENAASTSRHSDEVVRDERNKSESSTSLDQRPSSCVWAIVACCAPNNYYFRYGCFHYLSCTVAFWETEVCQLPVIVSAARVSLSYYAQFMADTTTTPPSVSSTTTSQSMEPATRTSVEPTTTTTTLSSSTRTSTSPPDTTEATSTSSSSTVTTSTATAESTTTATTLQITTVAELDTA